jgi:hypothetical protein
VDGGVETVVGGHLASDLPNSFGRIELGRVGRESVKHDAMAVCGQPNASRLVEPVARAVVDDEEDFASSVTAHEQLQKHVERVAVEDRSELIREAPAVALPLVASVVTPRSPAHSLLVPWAYVTAHPAVDGKKNDDGLT